MYGLWTVLEIFLEIHKQCQQMLGELQFSVLKYSDIAKWLGRSQNLKNINLGLWIFQAKQKNKNAKGEQMEKHDKWSAMHINIS